jgi:hypothetical protein
MDNVKKDHTYEIIPKDQIKIPAIPFPRFYQDFKGHHVHDIIKTQEWQDIYTQFFDFNKFEEEIIAGESREEMEQYDSQQQLHEFIKCANSFSYFCHKYIKILHPIFGLLPIILFKYQKRAIQDFENNRFNIVSKFRQGGLTTIAVLWSLWRCMFKTDQQILLLSKTDREAIAAGEIAKCALDHLPNWLFPKLSTDSKHEKIFQETESALRFYTPEAARGKSCTFIIIDEAAFIADMETHWKAMYPVIATGGACIVISTVNGIGNWYERMYHEAEAQENPFNVIDLEYWEHPDYCNPTWVEDTKANLGEKGWLQEVLRSFLGSGETFINSHIIGELDVYTRGNIPMRVLFEKWHNRQARNIDWETGALWVWREPQDGHEYILAADCSEGVGEGGDNNAFHVIDQKTLEQVAEFCSNVVPPSIFAQIIHQIGIYYNTALVVVENNGVGSAVCSALELGLSYENLHYDSKPGSKGGRVGINMGPANRPVLLEKIQNRLLTGTVRINSRRFVDELKTFLYNARTRRAEAQKGKHDDLIMSMSAAIYVRDILVHDVPIGFGEKHEDENNLFSTEIYKEIREEILRDSPEDYVDEQAETFMDLLNKEDTIPEIMFDFRRRHESLLREFGW